MLALPESDRTRHDEGNVANLGLISIQERIPPDYTEWSVEVPLEEGKVGKLSCTSPNRWGVPHGLDTDVSLALMALWQERGSPENGVVETKGYEILTLMGLPTTGLYYAALKESLDRLAHATYTAELSWRDNGSWSSRIFRYLDGLEFVAVRRKPRPGVPDDEKPTKEVDAKTDIRVTLGKEIVASLRSRFMRVLNYDLLISFKRPLTRALFRLLDSKRLPAQEAQPRPFYRVGLLEWADYCKLRDKRPDKVRRSLEGAHEELLGGGYLSKVEYEGRGSEQEIIYHFINQPVLDPKAVQQLTAHGLGMVPAQRYARQYSPEHINERVVRFEIMLARGFKPDNKVAFLVDVLKDETGKYADIDRFIRSRAASAAKPKSRRSGADEAEKEQARADFLALDATDQYNWLTRTCSLVMHKKLTNPQILRLFERWRGREGDYPQLHDQLVAAMRNRQYCEELAETFKVLVDQE